ncbi:AfsR/SARP family transcriptional regulator [Micromonospora siamensis]|uniref:DNA-binding transcriptional activator of the SARP family n=1 Tax=Micromonospora siamensis TaxID=299152 RepID=A0A1C5J1H2_9ACTN|nr:BTAD domain-containing putative transcriptional regulator [Micromonospora siamensis]SCG64424.1 DNA-binding transcriptional activator of the SARP family [Micromonospora siamensis]
MVPTQRVPYTLRLLGGFALDRDGRSLPTPHSVRRLLALLAVHPQRARAEAAGLLWPDSGEERARANLRTTLWRAHRLAPVPLVTGEERLALSDAVSTDVATLAATADRLAHDAAGPVRAGDILGGELLPGWYDDWVLAERERLRHLRLSALEALAARLTTEGRVGEAIQVALTAVHLEPLRESATRALIVAHLAEHNYSEAVRRLAVFRATLDRELGVRPTAELEGLVRAEALLPG